jgi:DNA invertase Pin-like site-specific DNA recombinase
MVRSQRRTLTVRAAIYTRKSSEEGLEQGFNSLDAQREACEAFVQSQKQEGWVALATHYDDGGVSGGSMKRPALERLLVDIAAGTIDTVVVYKVDRLTRSLGDFAKMVELFDRHQIAFVAVTQQFNTTSSMGRLTLNMLLSFAQFEREVTAERIRDKIAASKKKGLWMGGIPPLGYDVKDEKLVVNDVEAETIRHIYRRYVALGSVHALRDEMARDRVVSKRRRNRHGRETGGKPLARGALYLMLNNRLYRGEITHKGASYPGQHQPIIEAELWDQVQARLATNRVARKTGARAMQPSLLAGLVHDHQGNRLIPTHANKNGTRYRYYVSQPLIKQRRSRTVDGGWRLPAGDLERLVEGRLTAFLTNEAEVFDAIETAIDDIGHQMRIIEEAGTLAGRWPKLDPSVKRATLQSLVHRIEVGRDDVVIQLRPTYLASIVDPDHDLMASCVATRDDEPILSLTIAARLERAGMAKALTVDGITQERQPDRSLLRLLAQASRYRDIVMQGQGRTIKALAAEAGVGSSYFTRVFRLSFLAPDITNAILQGRHPAKLTAKRLSLDIKLDPDWTEQKKQLNIG